MRRARPLLGTIVEIDAQGDDADVSRAVERAFLAIERVHGLMSFHDSGSDVARMNGLAHRQAVRIDPWTWRVLKAAAALHGTSRGAFDCAVAPELIRRRYLPRSASASLSDVRGSTFSDVLLEAPYCVRFKRPLLLDLGGIAKGFAVDQAVRALRRAGVVSAVVNAGGDLRAFGPLPRRIHIRHPRHPGVPALVGELHNAALATSGSYYLRSSADAEEGGAIIDPRRSCPASLTGSVSVVAPTCMIADALTKVVAIAGKANGCDLARWRARAIVL